jgi:hypothetical protein
METVAAFTTASPIAGNGWKKSVSMKNPAVMIRFSIMKETNMRRWFLWISLRFCAAA